MWGAAPIVIGCAADQSGRSWTARPTGGWARRTRRGTEAAGPGWLAFSPFPCGQQRENAQCSTRTRAGSTKNKTTSIVDCEAIWKAPSPGGRGRRSGHKSELTAAVLQRVVPQLVLTDTRRKKPRWVQPPGTVHCVLSPRQPPLDSCSCSQSFLLIRPDLKTLTSNSQKVALLPKSRPKGNVASERYRNVLSALASTHPTPAQKVLQGYMWVGPMGAAFPWKAAVCVSSEN